MKFDVKSEPIYLKNHFHYTIITNNIFCHQWNNLIKHHKKIQQWSKKLSLRFDPLINTSKENLNRSFSKEVTMLNWQVGKHIDETLASIEKNYRLKIVATLSQLLR